MMMIGSFHESRSEDRLMVFQRVFNQWLESGGSLLFDLDDETSVYNSALLESFPNHRMVSTRQIIRDVNMSPQVRNVSDHAVKFQTDDYLWFVIEPLIRYVLSVIIPFYQDNIRINSNKYKVKVHTRLERCTIVLDESMKLLEFLIYKYNSLKIVQYLVVFHSYRLRSQSIDFSLEVITCFCSCFKGKHEMVTSRISDIE